MIIHKCCDINDFCLFNNILRVAVISLWYMYIVVEAWNNTVLFYVASYLLFKDFCDNVCDEPVITSETCDITRYL